MQDFFKAIQRCVFGQLLEFNLLNCFKEDSSFLLLTITLFIVFSDNIMQYTQNYSIFFNTPRNLPEGSHLNFYLSLFLYYTRKVFYLQENILRKSFKIISCLSLQSTIVNFSIKKTNYIICLIESYSCKPNMVHIMFERIKNQNRKFLVIPIFSNKYSHYGGY